MQAYRSSTWRSVTLSERMPPPTGVVSGPLIETLNSANASTVSSGSQLSNALKDFSPAKTSIHAMRRSPPYAFSTAASNTRTDAAQMSGPVPSPSMNGMMGLFGTWRAPPAYPIRSPLEGTVACLYVAILGLVVQGGKPEKVTPAGSGGPAGHAASHSVSRRENAET